MAVPQHIKRLASSEGFPVVKYEGRWNDREVYAASDPEFPFVGLPQLILSEGETARWASPAETDSIMAAGLQN